MLFLFRYLFLLLFVFLLANCDADLSRGAGAIVNDDAIASVEELLLELEIRQGDRYVVLDSINNIEVFINGKPWAVFDYQLPNQDRFDDLAEVNNFLTTDVTFSHKLVLNYLTTAKDFKTAGEFADFIRNFLQPGDYFCSIVSLSIYENDGQTLDLEIFRDFLIKVGEREKSIYVGEVSIDL